MIPFEYRQADSIESAGAEVVRTKGAMFYGGGTNLVDYMKLDVITPALLIDVKPLPLNQIEVRGDRVWIGANVSNSRLAADPLIRERYPVLSEALLSGASPQLRNMATTAGNTLQRTRCPYYRDVHSACNKREPGSGCDAFTGEHAKHAILGVSEQCIATHPSDMCVAMTMLEAQVHTRRASGVERTIPFPEFHLVPGETPDRETVLEHGELITHLSLPDLPFAKNSRYVKARDRASYEFALASAAVALEIEGGTIRQARIGLGGIATKPWRSFDAEAFLAGKPAGRETFEAAAEIALRDAQPLPENAYKVPLARRTLVVALTEACRRAKQTFDGERL